MTFWDDALTVAEVVGGVIAVAGLATGITEAVGGIILAGEALYEVATVAEFAIEAESMVAGISEGLAGVAEAAEGVQAATLSGDFSAFAESVNVFKTAGNAVIDGSSIGKIGSGAIKIAQNAMNISDLMGPLMGHAQDAINAASKFQLRLDDGPISVNAAGVYTNIRDERQIAGNGISQKYPLKRIIGVEDETFLYDKPSAGGPTKFRDDEGNVISAAPLGIGRNKTDQDLIQHYGPAPLPRGTPASESSNSTSVGVNPVSLHSGACPDYSHNGHTGEKLGTDTGEKLGTDTGEKLGTQDISGVSQNPLYEASGQPGENPLHNTFNYEKLDGYGPDYQLKRKSNVVEMEASGITSRPVKRSIVQGASMPSKFMLKDALRPTGVNLMGSQVGQGRRPSVMVGIGQHISY